MTDSLSETLSLAQPEINDFEEQSLSQNELNALEEQSLLLICHTNGKPICSIPKQLFQDFVKTQTTGNYLILDPKYYSANAVQHIIEFMKFTVTEEAFYETPWHLQPIYDHNTNIAIYTTGIFWGLDTYLTELSRNLCRSIQMCGNQISLESLDRLVELRGGDAVLRAAAKKLAFLYEFELLSDVEGFEAWLVSNLRFAKVMAKFGAREKLRSLGVAKYWFG
ncbi:hypothetical protein EJ04DRAFT_571230 [Polyplosphaeria fusca]|uniref:Uncharacterized protein n=1 Tax=Polyplosphaeria fusca TaxID=682080 RepID=A0A9P4UVS8_9PLEO|nr:hypothetical protein EJ04DRAFT_571230 [Polyplosphaeria fusca]